MTWAVDTPGGAFPAAASSWCPHRWKTATALTLLAPQPPCRPRPAHLRCAGKTAGSPCAASWGPLSGVLGHRPVDEVNDQQVHQRLVYHVSNTVLLGNVGTHIGTAAQWLVIQWKQLPWVQLLVKIGERTFLVKAATVGSTPGQDRWKDLFNSSESIFVVTDQKPVVP